MSNLSDFLVSKGSGYGLREVLTVDGTWDWVAAGKPSKVFIRMIGGAGGNVIASVGSNGGVGGNSVWDTGSVVATTTSTGGNGATTTVQATAVGNMPNVSRRAGLDPIPSRDLLGFYGTPNDSPVGSQDIFQGGYGELKEFSYHPNGSVNFTIGAGGTEGTTNAGAGNQGAIELYY